MTYQEGGERMKKITKIEGNLANSFIKPKHEWLPTAEFQQIVMNS